MAKFPIPLQLAGVFCQLGPHESFEWKPLPWKGIFNKVLFFDRCTGATIELAKIEKGCTFPEHYHTTVQTLFIIKGRIRTGKGQIIETGTFNVIPAGEVHGPFFAEEEVIQFKYFSAVPVYILKDGKTYIYTEDGHVTEAGTLSFALGIES